MIKRNLVRFGVVLALLALIIGCDNGTNGGGGYYVTEIDTLAELEAIGANAVSMSGRYKLTADITSNLTTPIGLVFGNVPIPFTGDFDGNGYSVKLAITNGLSVPTGALAATYAGLFAAVGDFAGIPRGTVHDLTVTGTITISGATLDLYAGGVAGAMLAGATISKVASSVAVTVGGSGEVYAGGIVGGAYGTVSNAYATGAVSATTSGNKAVYAGGIVGGTTGAVSYAYATGAISATGASSGFIPLCAGGIAGGGGDSGALATVRYTVALNNSVGVSGSSSLRSSRRITSTGTNAVSGGPNYGRALLVPTTGGSFSLDPGETEQDGVDVSAGDAADDDWWIGTGFSGANWTTVWEWDGGAGLPKLR